MTIRPIQLLGSPALRAQCEQVSNVRSPAVRVVTDDLQETFRDLRSRHGYGRGISAPQIGAPIRIIYIEVEEPLLLINPSIVDIGKRDLHVWDDCFSIPDLLVRVQRANRVKVEYEDLSGKTRQLEADGSLAELLQHEIEHLDGVLIVDHPVGLDPFCIREEWNKHYADAGKYSEPFERDPGPVL
ncbi:MAG: peptide deformylase [Gemmatimonadales bacterium]